MWCLNLAKKTFCWQLWATSTVLKAHDVLARAMTLLRDRKVACRAMIVGPLNEGKFLESLRKYIRDENLDIQFAGYPCHPRTSCHFCCGARRLFTHSATLTIRRCNARGGDGLRHARGRLAGRGYSEYYSCDNETGLLFDSRKTQFNSPTSSSSGCSRTRARADN